MSQRLSLSNGRLLDVGMSFICPDDEHIALTASPEAQAAVVEGLMTHEVTGDVIDRETGMNVTSVAKMTVSNRAGIPESTLYMSKIELIRHIYECRAILKSMDRAADLVDDEWKGYRERVRRRI